MLDRMRVGRTRTRTQSLLIYVFWGEKIGYQVGIIRTGSTAVKRLSMREKLRGIVSFDSKNPSCGGDDGCVVL